MRLTLIIAAMNDMDGYIQSWQMEPLAIGVLASLTPEDVDVVFYDDRVESIPFDEATDLVAISAETYCAQRAYEIAAKYRESNIPVVLGGFHPTLMPEESLEHCDCIITGNAENVWADLINDFKNGNLQPVYEGRLANSLANVFPDRSLFADKPYMPITLIESSRGCVYNCAFCSIASYYKSHCLYRPIDDVLAEVEKAHTPIIFFVDDNISSNKERAEELFTRLIPRKKKWISQISLTHLEDDDFVSLMAQSGCLGVLIGFESLQPETLESFNKSWNMGVERYEKVIQKLRQQHIFVYGTFVFGYGPDTKESFDKAFDFAMRNNLFLAAFNHFVPFPGTPLYAESAPRLRHDAWWRNGCCAFGESVITPSRMTAEELEHFCYSYKKKFYRLPNVLRRAWGLRRSLLAHLPLLWTLFNFNRISGRDTTQRKGFRIGKAHR